MSKVVYTVDDFKPLDNGKWGTPVEVERRLRITLSVATYAYEVLDRPCMSDAMWDVLAARINRWMPTGHPVMDEFFMTQFSPMTGMWIHDHPELAGIKAIYDRYYDRVLSRL